MQKLSGTIQDVLEFFVEIQFDANGKISGAAIRAYLVERSRVCQISDPERNYHCFCMLCSAPSETSMVASRPEGTCNGSLILYRVQKTPSAIHSILFRQSLLTHLLFWHFLLFCIILMYKVCNIIEVNKPLMKVQLIHNYCPAASALLSH